jgi:hypothetical protein
MTQPIHFREVSTLPDFRDPKIKDVYQAIGWDEAVCYQLII